MKTAGDYFFLSLNLIITIVFLGIYIRYLLKYLEFKKLCRNKDVVIANKDKVNLKIIFNSFLVVIYLSFLVILIINKGFIIAISTKDEGMFSGLLLIMAAFNYLNSNSEWILAENHIYMLERKETYKYKNISKVKIAQNKRNKNLYLFKIFFKDSKIKSFVASTNKSKAEEVKEFFVKKGIKLEGN